MKNYLTNYNRSNSPFDFIDSSTARLTICSVPSFTTRSWTR